MHRTLWGAALAVALVGGCAKDDGKRVSATDAAPHASRHSSGFVAGAKGQHVARPLTTPLYFEPNVGQADAHVRYLSRGNGYTLFLTDHGTVFSLSAKAPKGQRAVSVPRDVVRMEFADANPSAPIEGIAPLPSRSHYLVGDDPVRWRRNVANVAKVRYRDVYPGVDVVFYGNEGALEYDFILAAGADAGVIALDLQGVRSTHLTPAGDLVMATDHGELVQHRPVAYQTIHGQRVPVDSRYIVRSSKRIAFELGRHDPMAPVVLDPMLGFGTYLGGGDDDRGQAIAVDAQGNTYVAGMSKSVDFPVQGALQPTLAASGGNAFVAKFDASGNLVFNTYLGGTTSDFATGVAVDASGNVLVSGSTHSVDFPLVQAAQPAYGGNGDWFVAKLAPDGSSFEYSTYLGGSAAEEIEFFYTSDDVDGETLAVDADGNAYVTGSTKSDDFPVRTSLQTTRRGSDDAFVTKFAPDGSIVYSTYLGGSSLDYAHAIAVTADGHAYVAGSTMSNDFPTVLGFQTADPDYPGLDSQDGFVARLSVDGNSLDYGTYLGGSYGDRIHAIAVDGEGNAYVTGVTLSDGDFPIAAPIQACHQFDAFVSKISAAGDTLVYSTCLGGDWSSDAGREDSGFGIAVDSAGRATVVGATNSDNFPVASPMQATLRPGPGYPSTYADAFIATLAADGASLEFSTYFGGQGDDAARSVAVDADGRIYLAGSTTSPDMPTGAAAQPQYGSGTSVAADDVFVARIDPGTGVTVDDISLGEGYEGQTQATIRVHLSSPTDHPVTFDIATSDGTATAGDDYMPLALTAQTIAPGELDTTFTVAVNGDRTIEPDETFLVDLANVNGAVATDGHAVGTIRNDDPSLTIGNVSVVEGGDGEGAQAVFALTLAQPLSQYVTFRVSTQDVTTFETGDYGPAKGRLVTFPPGTTSQSIPIDVYGDTDIEPNETFKLVAINADFSGTGYAEGIGTILNDDTALSIADASITEGNSGTKQANFTVSLAQPTVVSVTFNVATANGTAAAGSDYTATSRSVTIPAGSTSVVVSVPVIGDTTIEANEAFQVAVSNVVGATVADGAATGTIVNDDTTLSIADASVVEGDSGTKLANFTVSLAQALPVPVTFNVGTANGTAAAGSDYTATSRTGVTIPAGGRSVAVSVPVIGDMAIEANETFLVRLSNVVGATVADGSATATLLNDDTKLSIADVSITEGLSGTKSATFTVRLSNVSAVPVTFNVATANKTAVAGSDYVARSLSGQSIPAGSTSKAFTIGILGDRVVEANETFLVNVSGVKGAQVADAQAVGTIRNDDAVLSIADASLLEGNSGTKSLAFTVKLTAALPAPVTLGLATANKTAVAGTDYVALSLAGQSIPAGATSKVFYVSIKGDVLRELNETFLVNVSGVNTWTGTSVIVGDSQAVGTIVNDD